MKRIGTGTQVLSPLQSSAAQLYAENAEQKAEIAALKGDNAKLHQQVGQLKGDSKQQKRAILGLTRRADAIKHVFTWSDNSRSDLYTFTEGVIGRCINGELPPNENGLTHWMGFELQSGPVCTMHYKCSILDPDDEVWWVASDDSDCDFTKPPVETAKKSYARSVRFELTEKEKRYLMRPNNTIKYRMVVHLYLPE